MKFHTPMYGLFPLMNYIVKTSSDLRGRLCWVHHRIQAVFGLFVDYDQLSSHDTSDRTKSNHIALNCIYRISENQTPSLSYCSLLACLLACLYHIPAYVNSSATPPASPIYITEGYNTAHVRHIEIPFTLASQPARPSIGISNPMTRTDASLPSALFRLVG